MCVCHMHVSVCLCVYMKKPEKDFRCPFLSLSTFLPLQGLSVTWKCTVLARLAICQAPRPACVLQYQDYRYV